MKKIYIMLFVLVGFGFFASSVNAQDLRPIVNPPHVIMYSNQLATPAPLADGLNTIQNTTIFSSSGTVRVMSVNFRAYHVGDFDIQQCTIIMNSMNVPSSITITEDRYSETLMTVNFTGGYLIETAMENSMEMICNLSPVPSGSMLLSVLESATFSAGTKTRLLDTTQYPVIDKARSTFGPLTMTTVSNGQRIYEVISDMQPYALSDWAVIIVPSGDYQNDLMPIGPSTKYFFLGIGDAKVTNTIRTLGIAYGGKVSVHNMGIVATDPGIGVYYDAAVFGDIGTNFEIVNCRIKSAGIGVSGSYNWYTTVADSEISYSGPRSVSADGIQLSYQNVINVGMGARVYRNHISRFNTGINLGQSYTPAELSPGSTAIDSNTYRSVRTPVVPNM